MKLEFLPMVIGERWKDLREQKKMSQGEVGQFE
jgi:hypothetical protein